MKRRRISAVAVGGLGELLRDLRFRGRQDDARLSLAFGLGFACRSVRFGLLDDGFGGAFGFGLAGVSGVPSLVGTGSMVVGSTNTFNLTNAKASALAVLFVSFQSTPVPFKGGTLAAFPNSLDVTLSTDGSGARELVAPSWPVGIPSGLSMYMQYAVADAAGPVGVSLSNAIEGIQP